MEVILSIIGSALFSWLITSIYFRKSLKQQSKEAEKEISQLLKSFENIQKEKNERVLYQHRLEESIQEYRKTGTPVRVIDTYDNMSEEEKANLYDAVMLREKGRLGKSNKYRNKKT
ncbi:MAG: hypothetical protein RDU59_10730 [Thermodesulfobacteriota bacterium]|nr:hypothetical protein [Thermodesulfobacteriota bacterium]